MDFHILEPGSGNRKELKIRKNKIGNLSKNEIIITLPSCCIRIIHYILFYSFMSYCFFILLLKTFKYSKCFNMNEKVFYFLMILLTSKNYQKSAFYFTG